MRSRNSGGGSQPAEDHSQNGKPAANSGTHGCVQASLSWTSIFKSSMTDRFGIACKNTCWIGARMTSNETQKVAL